MHVANLEGKDATRQKFEDVLRTESPRLVFLNGHGDIKRVLGHNDKVIFDENKLLAVGAIIKPHKNASEESGARSTAALSAYHYGGHPVKVSPDGEVTVYFASKNDEDMCHATIEFL